MNVMCFMKVKSKPVETTNSVSAASSNWRVRGSIVGHGDVPVAQCIGVLKRAGYDGVLSLEFEGMEHPMCGIEIGHENLRRYAAMA